MGNEGTSRKQSVGTSLYSCKKDADSEKPRTTSAPAVRRRPPSSRSRSTARTIMPRLSPEVAPWLALGPRIVYVLPLPVWPYAKIVALYPSSVASTSGFATTSKICACVVSSPNVWSKEKERPMPSGPLRAEARRTVTFAPSSWSVTVDCCSSEERRLWCGGRTLTYASSEQRCTPLLALRGVAEGVVAILEFGVDAGSASDGAKDLM